MSDKFTVSQLAPDSYILYQPVYAGSWKIGGSTGLVFSVSKRPRWLTRVMMKFLIEWEWCDEPTSPQPAAVPDQPAPLPGTP